MLRELTLSILLVENLIIIDRPKQYLNEHI